MPPLHNMNSDRMLQLKQRGNTAFRSGHYRDAIQLYTDALDAARSEGSTEEKRVLLSNRAQAYLQWGDIYNALRDTDLALSPEYTHTSPPSPASITRKCQWRRARVLNPLGRWMEAQAALDEYARLSSVMGEVRSAESVALEHVLRRALRLPHDSEVVQRVELLRALNARGIIVEEKYIPTFPESPFGVDEDYVDELKFKTSSERPNPALPDPFLTPLAVPVYVRAPHFPHPTRGGRLGMRVTVSEAPPELMTIGDHVDSLLTSFLAYVGAPKGKAGASVRRDFTRHCSEFGASILLMTQKGRLLVIPPETLVRDIWPRARWPREEGAPPPFVNLLRETLRASFEVDGPTFSEGWFLDLHVLPKGELDAFVQELQERLSMLADLARV